MKLVIITGSHRPHSNSNALAAEFGRGAKEAGHEVFTFPSATKNVHPCIGCNVCNMDGPCIFKDDMGDLRQPLIDADVVLAATPMYYFGFSAQIQAVFDRFYAFNPHITKPKDCYLIVALCGSDPKTAEGIERQYEIMTDFLHWTMKGKLIATQLCPEKAAIADRQLMARAFDMGRKIGK